MNKDEGKIAFRTLMFFSLIFAVHIAFDAYGYFIEKPKKNVQVVEKEKVIIGGAVAVDGKTIKVEFVDSATGTVSIADIEINLADKKLTIDFDPSEQVSFLTNEKQKEREQQIAEAKANTDDVSD